MVDLKDERPLVISFQQLLVAADRGAVLMRLGAPPPQMGFAPDLVLTAGMTPIEARELAERLLRKADEAEVLLQSH